MVSAKNVLMTDLGPIGSLDSPVINQIAQLSNPYSGVFSISRPTVDLYGSSTFENGTLKKCGLVRMVLSFAPICICNLY